MQVGQQFGSSTRVNQREVAVDVYSFTATQGFTSTFCQSSHHVARTTSSQVSCSATHAGRIVLRLGSVGTSFHFQSGLDGIRTFRVLAFLGVGTLSHCSTSSTWFCSSSFSAWLWTWLGTSWFCFGSWFHGSLRSSRFLGSRFSGSFGSRFCSGCWFDGSSGFGVGIFSSGSHSFLSLRAMIEVANTRDLL
ncbi:hypothetical protein D3C86_1282870 [compost metagenome]